MNRRRLGRIAVALLLVPIAVAVSVLVDRRLQNRQSELSESDWLGLRERFSRRATAAPAPQATPEPRAEPAVEEPPRRPELEPPDPDILARQAAEYAAKRPKSVVELQPFRRTQSIDVVGSEGRRGTASLVNLNPTINSWYLLHLSWADAPSTAYHLVNARPESQELTLDAANHYGVTLVSTLGSTPCDLWSERSPLPLERAARARSPYVTLCDDQLSLRIQKPGHRTTLEWATDMLRDNVWGGEAITVFVREKLFQDAFLRTAELLPPEQAHGGPAVAGAPPAARLEPAYADSLLVPDELGIARAGTTDGTVLVGRWYEARGNPGIFLSVVQPKLVDAELLRSHREIVSPLDEVELEALVYLVAFDLDQFELGFALGTEHPRVGWSERALSAVQDPSLPGPDGIADISPLIATGIIPRAVADRTAATFTGGFKRAHGAFRASELAYRNRGSHYGFVESGVILSKLQPGLATIYALDDGRVEMKTWTEQDDALLERLQFARQNGVPVVERDPEGGPSVPGALVRKWVAGNWSGSQDRKFRTVRAGAALVEDDGRRFLLYAYFSSATPSAMARVFQAYGAAYAMLLDMNALEHTYLAVYRADESGPVVEHLVDGMKVLDREVDGQTLPRFLGYADNRDFFYLLREPGSPATMARRSGGP